MSRWRIEVDDRRAAMADVASGRSIRYTRAIRDTEGPTMDTTLLPACTADAEMTGYLRQ